MIEVTNAVPNTKSVNHVWLVLPRPDVFDSILSPDRESRSHHAVACEFWTVSCAPEGAFSLWHRFGLG